MRMNTTLKTIDEYIAGYPAEVQTILEKIRKIICAVAPGAKETISYGIPTFKLNGKNLVHFAGYKYHVGFYPGSEAISVFEQELKDYATSKGTVQFQLDEPIPYDLVKRITEFRVKVSTVGAK